MRVWQDERRALDPFVAEGFHAHLLDPLVLSLIRDKPDDPMRRQPRAHGMADDAVVPRDDQQTLVALGRAIRELREARSWSASELADATGLQRSYVADLERGARNPTYRTLVKLATGLDTTLSALVERAEANTRA
jgi:ribosome-binding protein aMBF1 (putative translation factor)